MKTHGTFTYTQQQSKIKAPDFHSEVSGDVNVHYRGTEFNMFSLCAVFLLHICFKQKICKYNPKDTLSEFKIPGDAPEKYYTTCRFNEEILKIDQLST